MMRRAGRLSPAQALALALALTTAAVGAGCGGDTGAVVVDAGGGRDAAAARDGLAEISVLPCGGCAADEWCDESSGRCVACVTNAHCGADEFCEGGACVSAVCEPGTTTCADGVLRRCNDRGVGWTDTPCPHGEVCVGPICRVPLCEPGTVRCRGGLVAVCSASGLSEDVSQCADGQLCVPDEGCLDVRHDILVVMDTSGSMRRIPDRPEWFPWTDPWPVCESFDDPQTRIGIARKLFRRILAQQDTLLAESDFALFRFPQRVDGVFVKDLAAPASESCNFGLWERILGETMSGDDGRHVTGPGPGGTDWFVESLPQVLLVPDPRVPDFAAATAEERRAAMEPWIDGMEAAAPGADAVPCSHDTGYLDCGLDRACLGPEGARTCHDVTNPELRATGQTPLGRSLFYASEYVRRFVRVGGAPCETAADCASANYRCREGVCFDPLAGCRRTVIVLITDGVEDPVPDDRFFRARVQAKRLQFGLGCAADADCLSGATCAPVRVCADAAGAVGVVCAADDDCLGAGETCLPGVDACVTPALLAAGREDAAVAAALVFVDPEGAQRATDRTGAGLAATVHVLDVAGGAAENARISLLGGGLHLLHSLYELDAILADLRSVFDIKAGAQCLSSL
jgi:hypothetical protein